MKKSIFIILMVLTVANATAEDLYDSYGNYQGQINNNGSMYGADGSYQGQINNDGSVYGADGSYHGQIDD